MLALAIVSGILLALLALLLAPVSVRAAYAAGELRLSVHYLFLRFLVLPRPDEEPGEEPDEETDKPAKKKKPRKKTKWTAGLIWDLIKSTRGGLDTLRRHLVFYRVEIYAAVGGADAHQAAVRYGKLHAAIHCGLGVIGTLFPLRDTAVRLYPAFHREKTAWDVKFRARILPLFAAAALLQAAVAALKVLLKDRKDNKRKGGIPHESAASRQ